jgi:hypothetical protein
MNREEDKVCRQQFKTWCLENRLRLRKDEAGYPIATAIGKYKGIDSFYDGFGDDWVGVHVARETSNKFTYLHKRLLKAGCVPLAIGDDEGTYKIKTWNAIPLAKDLKIVKGAPRITDPHWLREK